MKESESDSSLLLVPVSRRARNDPRATRHLIDRVLHVAVEPECGLEPRDQPVELRGEAPVTVVRSFQGHERLSLDTVLEGESIEGTKLLLEVREALIIAVDSVSPTSR